MQRCVNLVDLVKSFQTSIYYLVFTCKCRLRYSRELASQSLPTISQQLEKKLEKHRLNIVTKYSNGLRVVVPAMETSVAEADELAEFKSLKRVVDRRLVGAEFFLGPGLKLGNAQRSLMWYPRLKIRSITVYNVFTILSTSTSDFR